MREISCPKCQYSPIASDVKVCPNCGEALARLGKGSSPRKKKSTTTIQVEQSVGEVTSGQVTGVQIGEVSGGVVIGYSATEVGELLEQISRKLQQKTFDGSCPYVGLDAFGEEDAARFFGRERLVAELVSRVRSLSFLAVAGPSGSGKSSLVRAGLVPALKSDAIDGSRAWLYTSLTPGRSPLEALGKALAQLAGNLQPLNDYRQNPETMPNGLLHDWVETLLGDRAKRRLVLVIDQFEEIFTQLSEADAVLRTAFLQQILQASSSTQSRLLVILTLRSDFVANCASYPGLNNLLNQGFFQVGPMAPDELVSAIARPALDVGLPIEPELVSQILADMRQEPGALPLMQFALKDLFEFEQAKGGVMALTLGGYLERGGLHRALARYADDAFSHLSEDEQKLAESIFRGLVMPGRGTQDARRTALFDELTPASADRSMVEKVIHRLADARLITTDDRPETPEDDRTVTLAHERLLEAWPWLRRLVDENREAIVLQVEIEQDAVRWEDNQRDESYLYTGARLATAQERLEEKKLSLSKAGAAFIAAAVEDKQAREQAEREAREAEQRRELETARRIAEEQRLAAEAEQRRAAIQRRMLQIVGALLVMAVILTVWAMMAQLSANENFREASEQAGTATSALGVSYLRGTEAAQQRELADSNAIEANRQAELALSRQLAAQALTELLQGNQSLALKLASHANRINDTPAARSALLTALQENPRLTFLFTAHKDYVLDLAAQPGGSLLASAGCGGRDLSREKCLFGEIRLWDLSLGKPTGEVLGEHGNAVRMVQFSPDGRWLASVDDDGVINLWDAATRSLEAGPLADLDGSPGYLAFSSDSTVLFARRQQEAALLAWDLSRHAQISGELFPGLPDNFRISTMHPGGRYLAGRDERNVIQIWAREASAGRFLLQAEIDAFSMKEAVGMLLGGTNAAPALAISAGADLVVYDARTGRAMTDTMSGHRDTVRAMAFSDDNQYLASAGLDRTIRIWHLPSWFVHDDQNLSAQQQPSREITLAPLLGHMDNITSLAFAMNGKYLVSGSRDLSVRVWNWAGEELLGEPVLQLERDSLGMKLSPDGSKLAFAGCAVTAGENCIRGKVSFYDFPTINESPNVVEGHSNLVNTIAYSPNGLRLASGSWDGTIIIWDTATSTPLVGPFLGHDDFVTDVAFSPDGDRLVSSSRDGSIKIWDASDGSQVGEALRGQTDRVTTVAWSPLGDKIASGGRDASVILWDISATDVVSTTLEGHLEQIGNVLFSPDGRLLASTSADRSVIIWDVDGKKLRMRLQGHSERATSLAFSPDGLVLASGSWDNSVRLWDTVSGQQIGRPLTGHGENIGSLAFTADGAYLYSSSLDGRVIRWEMDPGLWLQRACRIVVQDLDVEQWHSLVGPDVDYSPVCAP